MFLGSTKPFLHVVFDSVITLNLIPCQKYATASRYLNSPNAETLPANSFRLQHWNLCYLPLLYLVHVDNTSLLTISVTPLAETTEAHVGTQPPGEEKWLVPHETLLVWKSGCKSNENMCQNAYIKSLQSQIVKLRKCQNYIYIAFSPQ